MKTYAQIKKRILKDEEIKKAYKELKFADEVYAVVCKISKGKVATYKSVAAAIGSPRASRAVANALAGNFDPKVPCHRVVRSDGRVGGYNRGGVKVKQFLLKKEGVEIKNSKVDLEKFSCLHNKS